MSIAAKSWRNRIVESAAIALAVSAAAYVVPRLGYPGDKVAIAIGCVTFGLTLLLKGR